MAKPKRICVIPECGKWRFGHGYCSAHYSRWRRHGDPLGGSTPRYAAADWLQDHVLYDGEDCIEWPFARGRKGDSLVRHEGRQVSAANLLCRLAHGEPPTPLHEAAHSCGNGHLGCMNRNHLRWATRSENMLDKALHGTQPRGKTHFWTKLAESDVRAIRAAQGTRKLDDLAAQFGVNRSTISAIWRRKNWAWLSD